MPLPMSVEAPDSPAPAIECPICYGDHTRDSCPSCEWAAGLSSCPVCEGTHRMNDCPKFDDHPPVGFCATGCCHVCSILACVSHDRLHFHPDGCPSCGLGSSSAASDTQASECPACGDADHSVDECPVIASHPPTGDCDDAECTVCAVRDCPFREPFHYHHDGCPACYVHSAPAAATPAATAVSATPASAILRHTLVAPAAPAVSATPALPTSLYGYQQAAIDNLRCSTVGDDSAANASLKIVTGIGNTHMH